MDDRVRRVEDFELSLGLPVLAMVPRVELATAPERATVVLSDVESQPSEAFRGLRASLLLDKVGREARCVMVVSAGAAEGKSLVASNLAAIIAQSGERTLLIDGDLRRPSIHKLMDLHNRKGLPHLLDGKATWDEAIVSSPHENLDIMTGAGAPRDPAPLLASPRLGPVLDQARETYDRVVVDCPPLFGVSDPLLLLSHVDGVVLVALYNRTHRRAIAEATQKLLDGEAPILGAVINGVEFASHSYYYHRYGYKYYYGRRSSGQQQG
jgi:capsular exopolysaccharide synthesis family protein